MRATPQDELHYLRMPADEDFTLQGFMGLRALMFDKSAYTEIAQRLSATALAERKPDEALRAKFEESVVKLMQGFSAGGYTQIASLIEKSVPPAEREKAAQTYIKIISGAAFEAYNLSRERAGKPPLAADAHTQMFIQESLNAISDIHFYGAPLYLQMTKYEHRQASGLQLTRSPGKTLVYSGSLMLVLGIFSMLFIRERRIWLLVKSQSVLFAISANRKNRDLVLEFERYHEQLQRLLQS